jgi:DNA-binding beta-propeller fold protein YncE
MFYFKRMVMRCSLTLIVAASILIPGNYVYAQSQPYRSIGTWGNLPDGREWGAVSWVYPDKNDNIWVLERCGKNTCLGSELDPVLQFDPDGNLIKSFGGGMFAWPHALYIDQDGYIWVTDASGHWIADALPYLETDTGKGHTIVKFSPDGEVLLTLGQPGVSGKGQNTFYNPNDLVIAPSGDIFIVDGHKPDGNHRIVKFSAEGKFLKEWGSRGIGPGEFEEPHSIAMDSKGRLFVADRGNNRIQIFDQDGNYLEQWIQYGRPSGIFIDENDMMIVTDPESNYQRNPGWERGIRIGSARDGWVQYFIPDPEPNPNAVGTSGAEYAVFDSKGNVYGAEVGPRNLNKHIKLWE